MVQSNVDGRSRTRRTKQSEEQAPLVESYLSSNSSTIYHGQSDQPTSAALLIQKTRERWIKQMKMSDCVFDQSVVFTQTVWSWAERDLSLFVSQFLFPIKNGHYKVVLKTKKLLQILPAYVEPIQHTVSSVADTHTVLQIYPLESRSGSGPGADEVFLSTHRNQSSHLILSSESRSLGSRPQTVTFHAERRENT